MTWDAIKRVWLTDDGDEIAPADLRDYLDQFIDDAQDETDQKSQKLLAGMINEQRPLGPD